MTEPIRDKVFISYSHNKKDLSFLEQLLLHLKPLERAGCISHWSDQQIAPGSKWLPEIEAALAASKVAVMLVTPAFLASDFIHEHELGPLLKKAEQGGVTILWVYVRACSYKETPLKDYQAAFPPDKALAQMKAERDAAWVEICQRIKQVLDPQ
jgi:internalin A